MRLYFLILTIFITSFILNGAETKEMILKNKTEIFDSEIIGEYKFTNINGIDYLEISDLTKLLKKSYKTVIFNETEKEIVLASTTKDFEIKINLEDSSVYKFDKKMKSLSKINASWSISNDTIFDAFKEKSFYNLEDFGVEIIDKKYFPICLIGKVFFENISNLYESTRRIFFY